MPDFLFVFLTHEENIYLVFFSHFPFNSMWGHIDPKDQKCKHFLHTFRTTKSSPVFFVCMYEKSQNLISLRWREPFFLC